MKVSLNWVKEFTDVKLPVDKLVEKIGAQLGAVEEVIDFGKKYRGIVIVKVISCQPHPNADKLKVCTIDDGGNTPGVKRDEKGLVEVVCGAPNVKEGMFAAWLPPGTVVPSTFDKDPLKLEAREIRGVVSNGMLASAHELAINDNHSGIVEIDEDTKPGADFAQVYKLNDYIIDIENKMFTHRPDLFGNLGVAREIAGITEQHFTSPPWYSHEAKFEFASGLTLNVKVEDSKLVPRFMAVAMKDVRISSSPLWLQARLSVLGIRPINNVVDLTNYYMALTAQPLHAYDYDKVKAQDPSAKEATLMARLPKKGEMLALLGGKVIKPHDKAILIATATKPVGLGGVMGGADTEVDENTTNIILECANFDMYSIRKTAMEHGLFTDAVTRFTKGQSPLQNDRVLIKIMEDIAGISGGRQASPVHDIKANLAPPQAVKVSAAFINERLGLNLSPKRITELLENVEFKVLNLKGGQLGITPLFWRTDIAIPEDIVEEVGRLYGYDHLPLELPKRDITPAKKNKLLELKTQIRNTLSSAGANEVLTYSFVHGNLLDRVGQDKEQAFKIANALSPDLQYYRLSLTPSLLDKVHANIKAGYDEVAIFEIGKAHIKDLMDDREKNLPAEEERLAFVFGADDKMASGKYTGSPYYVACKYMMDLLDALGIKPLFEPSTTHEPRYPVSQQAFAPFEKTRAAYIKTIDGQNLGILGEYKAGIRRNLKLPQFIAGFELDVTQLLKAAGASQSSYTSLPRFPKVEQDISLKVAATLSYQEVFGFVWEELGKIQPEHTLPSLDPVDIYQREDDPDHKQITLRLSIASYERTMTAQEVNTLLDKVAEAANEKFGAERI